MFSAAVQLAYAQYTPPAPPLTTGPCKPTKDYPCTPLPDPAATAPAAASKFPFPGEAPAPNSSSKPAPAEQFPFPGEPPATTTPAAPTAAPGQSSTADKFPFPGEPPADATPASGAPGQKFPFPDDASSSSSSSSSTPTPSDTPSDADKTPIADKGSYGSTRASRRKKLTVPEDLDGREAEDLDVSHYYATTGNFQGSYLRAQDAVKTIPDDPLAHFALAESAKNLKKTDEAVAEYKLYLKMDPEGEKVKAAKHALADLGVK